MEDSHRNLEVTIIHHLEEREFVIEPGSISGEYIVTANGDTELPLRPKLSLSNEVLSEYLAAMSQHHQDEPDPVLEALSLTEIHIEEQLAKVDLDGHNHAKGLGFRRGAEGQAEWFVERDEPAGAVEFSEPSADLVWQADPPGKALP